MLKKLIKKHSDKIRFLIVGTTNTVIDFGLLFGLVNLIKLPVFYSNIASTSVALTFSFIANKKFTFKDNSPKTKAQLARFLLITLAGLWVFQPLIIAIVDVIFNQSKVDDNLILLAGKLFASCFTLVWNYLMYRKFVFNNTKDKNETNK